MGRLLGEAGGIVQGQVAVDLVGGVVVIAHAVTRRPRCISPILAVLQRNAAPVSAVVREAQPIKAIRKRQRNEEALTFITSTRIDQTRMGV